MLTELMRASARAAAVAVVGALAGVICVVGAFIWRPAVTLDMDRELPPNLSGVYGPERDGRLTFAWTSGDAALTLPGIDRRVPWECTVRFRGGRASPPQPVVDLAVDGITLASRVATNDYEDLSVMAPLRDRPGLVLSIRAAPTVVPGPHDPRPLGVQLDRLTCRPAQDATALPPRRAMTRAMLAAAAFAAALALIGITLASAIGAALLVAAAQAFPLTAETAPYGPYVDHVLRLSAWIAFLMVLVTQALQRAAGQRLRQTARFVLAFSAIVLYLKLAGLLHPSKTVVDTLFQAHRLEWVLAGRYFFTQPMPGGVTFPYAIGLYVFSAPWSLLTRDYMTLLRVVVCAVDALAGAMLYLTIVRTRGDRLAGAIAAALFGIAPLSFWFTGNGNLTNAFAQAVAAIAVAAATILPLRPGHIRQFVLLTVVTGFAFLSHVATFALLAFTLCALAALFVARGGPALRAPALRIAAATILAAVVSVALYYGHFGEVYKRAWRVRADAPAAAQPAPSPGGAAARPRTAPPFHIRAANALDLTRKSLGWPMLLLTVMGVPFVWGRGRGRDRLAAAVAAWTLAYAVFFAVGVMRVGADFQRYSYEFVGRVTLATYPAAAILAAHGAVWLWRGRLAMRVLAAALLLLAVAAGVREWLAWLE